MQGVEQGGLFYFKTIDMAYMPNYVLVIELSVNLYYLLLQGVIFASKIFNKGPIIIYIFSILILSL
jgi:hypothetical protein